jgi:hypothetical protein
MGKQRIICGFTAAVLGWLTLSFGPGTAADAKIAPEAEKVLRQACRFLGELKAFSFQTEDMFDAVQEDGQKLQLTNRRTVTVSRPGRLMSESSGDVTNMQVFYDGKSITLFDKENKTYGTAKVPGTIDAMLDEMHEKYGLSQPLADLLFTDPYKALTDRVESGTSIGLSQVGEHKCHHLAFRQKTIDWQIWIDASDKPLFRKLVITYKRQAGEPQYIAIIHRWDLAPKVTDVQFQFNPPSGAQNVEFVKVYEKPAAEKPPVKK